MNVTSFVFSPTGGTSRVSRALTSVWHDVHYTQIDLTKPDYPYENVSLLEDEVCYISFPVYEGRVPKVILERLARVKVTGTRLVMVAVYGNRAIDYALLEMKHAAVEMGFRPIAAVGQLRNTPFCGSMQREDRTRMIYENWSSLENRSKQRYLAKNTLT